MKAWDAIYQEWKTDDGQIHAQRMGLLIRCKDCVHYRQISDTNWGRCKIHREATHGKRITQSVDYCAWAERKEE